MPILCYLFCVLIKFLFFLISQASSAIFETRTKERIRPFDDAEEEEDIWEDKEINYATQVKARSRFIKRTHTYIDTQNSHCSDCCLSSLGLDW